MRTENPRVGVRCSSGRHVSTIYVVIPAHSNIETMSKRIFGYIYKISHKDIPNKCYVGKTELTIRKRFEAHIRDAKKATDKDIGDAKLHSIMWAHGPKTFDVEELATAKSLKELSNLEIFYSNRFDSIKNGWNKVAASKSIQVRNMKVRVKVGGNVLESESLASLCRELDISYSTVNYWRTKKGTSLEAAIRKAQTAREQTEQKEMIQVFRKKFKDVNELAKSKFNKHKLHPQTIRKRVRDGQTYEDALLQKGASPKAIQIKYQNKNLKFDNKAAAHKALSKMLKKIPTYSSVIASINKGHTYEQAFGIDKPKWEKDLNWVYDLVNNEGYTLTGKLDGQSKPVVYQKNKEVFSSVKVFARTYGFEYTTIAAEIKKGLTAAEIVEKRE